MGPIGPREGFQKSPKPPNLVYFSKVHSEVHPEPFFRDFLGVYMGARKSEKSKIGKNGLEYPQTII